MKRIHIEDYSIRGGYARVLVGLQEVEFNFSMSQAIEAAVDLGFILEPLSYDNEEVITTHPLFPSEMSSNGVERKCKMSPLSVLNELSGDEQTELVRHLAVQQYEIHI